MAFIPQSGSVVAFQGNPSVLQALVTVTNPVTVSSISGTVGASVIGTVPITQAGTLISSVYSYPTASIGAAAGLVGNLIVAVDTAGNSRIPLVGNHGYNSGQTVWVAGIAGEFDDTTPTGVVENQFAFVRMSSVRSLYTELRDSAGNNRGVTVTAANELNISTGAGSVILAGTPNVNTAGSVVAFQGGSPWTTVRPAGSITTVANIAGSIAAVSATAPAGSVMTVAALAGSIAAVSATVPAGSILSVTNPAGSVTAVLATQVTSPWIVAPNNSSLYSLQLAGSILTVTGINVGSVSGAVTFPPGSIATVVNPAGSITAVSAVQPAGSLLSAIQVAGSVMGVRTDLASVIAISTNVGSVITVPTGSVIAIQQANSIVGTYAEDAGHTTADKGVFVLGVRNDAVSSMTSAESDYSPLAVDSSGRAIVVPFAGPQACIISYVGSIVSGSVQLIQASVIGSRSYITDFWLSNTGAAATLVTFQGGDTSILGQFIAPTTGGMSSPGLAIPLRTTLSQDLAFKVSPSSSVLYVSLKGYQAP